MPILHLKVRLLVVDSTTQLVKTPVMYLPWLEKKSEKISFYSREKKVGENNNVIPKSPMSPNLMEVQF